MMRSKLAKLLLPLLVVLVGLVITAAFIRLGPRVETEARTPPPPLVRVMVARQGDVQLTVDTQGTVAPRNESTLVSEVSGRVLMVSEALAAGGFFEKGDVLLRIDDADYQAAAMNARAVVAQTELRVAREEQEAEMARRDWQDLGSGDASPLTLREPQVADARAALEAARAALRKAERDLERTRVRSPFDGRVRNEQVDVGQFVVLGQPLATVYSVDFAEVRLPLPDAELAHLTGLPLGYDRDEVGPEVILRGRFAGDVHEWRGRIVRTEGEIDRQSRMVHVVAQVEDPYGRRDDTRDTPLAVGLFVDARIIGRLERDVFVLPRAAMRQGDRVFVVEADGTLRFRQVDIVQTARDHVVVGAGLADGELVCLSPLDTAVDGMTVRTTVEEPPASLMSLLEVSEDTPPSAQTP